MDSFFLEEGNPQLCNNGYLSNEVLAAGCNFKRRYFSLGIKITPSLQRREERNCPSGSENWFFKLPWGETDAVLIVEMKTQYSKRYVRLLLMIPDTS
jgi:hypothetical protein